MDSKTERPLATGGIVEHPEKMLENLAGCPYEDGTIARLYNFKEITKEEWNKMIESLKKENLKLPNWSSVVKMIEGGNK